ncbi:PAS domain S-box protein [uncultured Mesonia sp.]|uniref:PAS domain S-box protein n=1 Tax=uncultured Mesonia sp. TaxID=399731 RepID=UPI00374F4F25
MHDFKVNQEILDDLPDLIWVVDTKMRLVYANQAYHQGIKKAIGRSFCYGESVLAQEYDEESRQIWRVHYKKALEGAAFEIEDEFFDPKQHQIVYNHIAIKSIQQDGKSFVFCIGKNITQLINQCFRVNNLLNASLDVFCTIDREGIIQFISSTASLQWGYSPQSLRSRELLSLVRTGDREASHQMAKSIIRKGTEVRHFLNYILHKDGREIPFYWSARWDETQELMYCVARDASDYLLQERKLQQREQHFKALVQEGVDLMLVLTADARFLYINKNNWFPKTDLELNLIGRNALALMHQQDREAIEKTISSLKPGERKQLQPFRIRYNDEEWRWLSGVLTNMQENPAVQGLVLNAQDITQRIEEREHLELLYAAINSTQEAVIITKATPLSEPGPEIIYVNQAFSQLMGYTPQEIIGKTPRILQGANTDRASLNLIRQHLELQESFSIELLNYTRKGQEVWVDLQLSPVTNTQGEVTHFIAIQRDITHEKRARLEKELLADIKQGFSAAENLLAGCQSLCENIYDYGYFEFVELWMPTQSKEHIQLVAYHSQMIEFYERYGRLTTFGIDEGLPGKIWREQTTLIWDEVEIQNYFIRREALSAEQIKYVMAVPIFYQAEFLGCLVLASNCNRDYIERYREVAERLQQPVAAELQRKILEDTYKNLYNTIPEFVCMLDIQGRVLNVNPAGLELMGYSASEMQGKDFSQFIYPPDLEETATLIQSVFEGQIAHDFQNRYYKKNGELIWFSWSCRKALSGEVIFVAGKDITQEKLLQESNQRACEMAQLAFWEYDCEHMQMHWSKNATHILTDVGAQKMESLTNILQHFKGKYKKQILQAFTRACEEQDTFELEVQLSQGAKEERWVRLQGSPVPHPTSCKKISGSIQDISESKRLQLQIEEILGSISDAFYAINTQWEFTYFNRMAEELLDRKADEVLGESLFEVFPITKDSWLFEQFLNAAQNQESSSFEYQYPEDQRWYEINIYPSASGLSVYFKNIDERIYAARALEEAFAEKSQILESIGDAFFTLDAGWNITYWNQQASIITGVPKEIALGNSIWEIFPEAYESNFYKNYKQALATHSVLRFEAYYEPVEAWFQVAAYPANQGLSVYFSDITEKKQAEEALKQANERFEKITQATQDAIWDWNLETNAIYLGEGFNKLFGHNTSYVHPDLSAWTERIHPDDLEEVNASLEEVIASDKDLWVKEYRYRLADGNYAEIIDRGLLMRTGQGKAYRMVGVMEDITKQKQYQQHLKQLNADLNKRAEELQRSNEELEQFAFIISHDLQEPLRMVNAFMNQLQRRYGEQLDERANQYIHFAADGAQRMKHIILDLLTYSRVGRPTEKLELVDLNEVMADFKHLRRKLIQENKAQLQFPDLPSIPTYKAVITQIFHGLLDNALKYKQPGKPAKIKLTCEEEAQQFVFGVHDQGIGIAPQFFDKIFVIFQRLHNREEYPGTGIGLAMVKKGVQFLGGKIWLASTPGQGTSFYFTLKKNIQA